MTSLPPELHQLKMEIEAYARDFNLDFFDVIFEVLDWNQLNEIASYGGFPNRYPHWRFGMTYEELSKSYAYGLSKIYEMVINTDPCYAYLLYSNSIVDQKLVMAHVYGHADFFKNNVFFQGTNRKMMDEMANHKSHILRYIDKYGRDLVENFIDACLSLDSLIDFHAVGLIPEPKKDEPEPSSITRLKASRPYMERYINPKEFIQAQQEWLQEGAKQNEKVPPKPQRDILQFLLEHAPLENWQHDILSIVREEAYYFAPQVQTKIMNEGWSCFWHSKIMTEKALKTSEIIDYADHHSGTLATAPGKLNPYKLGFELFKDIEERWNKGKFGKEFEECDSMLEKKNWDRKLGLGQEKIFEVRKLYNDITFIDNFLTDEFCQKNKLFVYAFDLSSEELKVANKSFDSIKQKLLFQLTNSGFPMIDVIDANHKNRAELLLKHTHEGVDLRQDYAFETLSSLYKIWKRPVHIKTVVDGIPKILSFDGQASSESRV
ncbi:MAG: SpoVR family protein [Pseudomonadota bacterium]